MSQLLWKWGLYLNIKYRSLSMFFIICSHLRVAIRLEPTVCSSLCTFFSFTLPSPFFLSVCLSHTRFPSLPFSNLFLSQLLGVCACVRVCVKACILSFIWGGGGGWTLSASHKPAWIDERAVNCPQRYKHPYLCGGWGDGGGEGYWFACILCLCPRSIAARASNPIPGVGSLR